MTNDPAIGKPGRPRSDELTARRREEILDVAGRIFAERGFPGTDVQVVADQLGLGKGTIYRYFPTKRELFLAAVDRGMRRLLEQVDAAVARVQDPLEQIAGATRAYLEFFAANPWLIELLIQERAEFKDRSKLTYFEYRDRGVGRWHALLRGLIAAGRVRDVPVERVCDAAGDLLYGTMFTNYFVGQRRSAAEQAQDVLDLLFHGILVERPTVREREE